MVKVEVEDLVDDRAKCTRPPVQTAGKNVKCRSSQAETVRSTAEIVSPSVKGADGKFPFSSFYRTKTNTHFTSPTPLLWGGGHVWHTFSRPATMDLKQYVRDIPDFPTPGILFRDITPLLQNGPAFHHAIQSLAVRHHGKRPEAIVAIESRGLIVGAALAYELGIGVVPVRRKGKLPHQTYRASYTLEYGQDTLEIHRDALVKGARVLLVDDLLATGGTMGATIQLIEQCGGQIIELAFLIELTALNGRERLAPHPIISLIQY